MPPESLALPMTGFQVMFDDLSLPGSRTLFLAKRTGSPASGETATMVSHIVTSLSEPV